MADTTSHPHRRQRRRTKNKIGTSRYVIYNEQRQKPLLHGYAVETQLTDNPSVTRQELLGQLCLEFWITQLFHFLGDPGHTVEMKIVTDSQASIIIMQNIQQTIGMSKLLKTDIDVAMELLEVRKQNLNIKREL